MINEKREIKFRVKWLGPKILSNRLEEHKQVLEKIKYLKANFLTKLNFYKLNSNNLNKVRYIYKNC